MDRLASMTVFLAVVEAGSFSAASRKLAMPLATVSRNVSELETHLKARLLNRSTRKLTLTDAGREYLAACKRILEDVGEAERTVSGEFSTPKGELVITAPIVFGRLHVLPVIAEFLKAYPDVDVRLVQSDRIANLLEDHVDLAVRVGALPDSNLSATRVGDDPSRRLRQPGLFRRPRCADDTAGSRRASMHHLRRAGLGLFLEFRDGCGSVAGARALAPGGEHRRGRHRCRDRRHRHHPRAFLPDAKRPAARACWRLRCRPTSPRHFRSAWSTAASAGCR